MDLEIFDLSNAPCVSLSRSLFRFEPTNRSLRERIPPPQPKTIGVRGNGRTLPKPKDGILEKSCFSGLSLVPLPLPFGVRRGGRLLIPHTAPVPLLPSGGSFSLPTDRRPGARADRFGRGKQSVEERTIRLLVGAPRASFGGTGSDEETAREREREGRTRMGAQPPFPSRSVVLFPGSRNAGSTSRIGIRIARTDRTPCSLRWRSIRAVRQEEDGVRPTGVRCRGSRGNLAGTAAGR